MRGIKLTIIFLVFFLMITSVTGTMVSVSVVVRNNLISYSSEDSSRINSLTRSGIAYVYKSPPVARAFIDTAVAFCEKKNIEIPSLLHLLKAKYYYYTGDFRSASEEAAIAMKKAESSGESDVLVKTMVFLGNYNLLTGFFKESADYFDKSIAFSKKMRLKGIIPLAYKGKSNLYIAIGDLKKFRMTLQMMIEAALAENDSLSAEEGYYLLGTNYCGENLSDKRRDFRYADSLLKKCNEISRFTKDTSYNALSLANIGWNFYLERKYDSSLYYYNKALTYSLPGKIHGASVNSFGNIGTIYRDLGNRELALKNYLKAVDQAKKINDWYNLSWIYKDMSDMYLTIKDTANAFISFLRYKQFSDSLLISKNTQGMVNAKVRYEADTHNKEVELLSLRLKNQRLLNYGITGFLVLVLGIVLLILSRAKINSRRRISEMNRKISEVTQANLRQQMNPHFIFNTLNSIQYYMYQHDKLATNIYLTKFSSLMRKVLENSQHTSVPLNDELDALNLYLELESIRFKDKFDYEIKIDEDIDTHLFKVPTMLIQPYVENSICHGLMPREGKGFVKIDLNLGQDQIICTIEDNGIGREAAQARKMSREGNHNSLGTQITSSRLELVNALYGTSLETIYTDLKNEKGEPEGTRVEIHIPIMT
jgi:two-component system LytT family sensor kinase